MKITITRYKSIKTGEEKFIVSFDDITLNGINSISEQTKTQLRNLCDLLNRDLKDII